MIRHRKILLALLAGAGLLLALLVALFLLAPRLINTVAIKERALALLERETGVRLSYARADVTLFPRPRVAIRGVGLDLPGVAHGTAAALEADADLLPLLRGKVRIGGVLLSSPDFRIHLPAKEKKEKPVSLEEVRKEISLALAALERRMPGTVFTVRDGRLELSDADGPLVSLRDLSARAALSPDRLVAEIRCSSQYWEGLAVETSVRTEGLRSETRVETERFRLGDFVGRIAPGATPWLGETVLSLRSRIESEGLGLVKAEVTGSVPTLTIRGGARSRVVRVRVLKGTLVLNDREVRAALSELVLDEPVLRLSGELAVDRVSPRIAVNLAGKDLEIPSVREALLALAGDVPTVRDILDVVRGGRISRFSFRTGGRSPGELGNLDALAFQATLSGGFIQIPGPDLPLEEVGAEVTMEKGTLAGKGISARMGNARATGGSLRIGFAEDDPPFHSEFQVDADVGELPPLLRRLVRGGAFREELDQVREVRGGVSGQVVLGERLSSVGVRFQASKVRCTGKYDRIPFPVSIDAGQVSYDGASVAVTGLGGKVGNSSFSGVTGNVALSDTPMLSVRSGTGRLVLAELYPWVSSFDSVRKAAPDVRSLRGTVEVGSLSMEGPLRGAGEWVFDATGTLSGLELDTPLLPGPLSVPAGRFRIRPESVSFSGVEASLLDATLQGTLELNGYRRGSDRIAAAFEGGIGPETAKWAYERIGIPEPFRVKAPYTVTGAEISREGEAVQAKVDMRHPASPILSFSVRAEPGKTTIDPLVIRGADSDAKMALRVDPSTLRLQFSGTLARDTVEKILPIPPLPGHRIRGELEVEVDRAKPARSSARGTLTATEAKIPWEPLEPLAIHALSVEADGKTVRVLSSSLAWDNVPFSLTGTAKFEGEKVSAVLDVSAGRIDLKNLLRSLKPSGQPGGTPRAAASSGAEVGNATGGPSLPVQGTVRLAADSVSLRGFTFQAVKAVAYLEGNTFRISISEANLCGISTLGSATVGAGEPSFTLVASASGENIQSSIECFTENRETYTGKFSLSSRLEGEGTGDALLRSLAGPVTLDVTDGRIRKMTVLSKVLAFLNVTETFRGKFPDFREEGFAYRNLSVRAEVKGGKYTVKELRLDSPSMQVFATGEVDLLTRDADLKVLVLPFQNVDAIIRKIPIVGYILGGTLISVPVSVKGDIRDPTVKTMETASMGSGLLDIVERTVKTPLHLISPILPGKEKKETGGATP
ncbi:MAG TPA: AsmA-like C-terminal domain-containing protein [Candidatus Deferrimicrobiaceae bacterium]